MNLLFRNFWNTLRRYKVASILNILGLSIAFAAFAILMMQVVYHLGHDKFHSNYDRIYRIESYDSDENSYYPFLERPTLEKMAEAVPGIRTLGILDDSGKGYFALDPAERVYNVIEAVNEINPLLLEVFDFRITAGSADNFRTDRHILMPESMAERLFPGENPIGQDMVPYGSDSLLYEVAAVYRDFPDNSILGNHIYRNMGERDIDNKNVQSYSAFIVLAPDASLRDVRDQLETLYRETWNVPDDYPYQTIRLSSLSELRYSRDVQYDWVKKSNKAVVYALLFIAFLIVVIASINFVNFSTSLVPVRIRSINTKKVMGGSQRSIRISLIMESVLISFLSGLIAILVVHFVSVTGLSAYLQANITLGQNGGIIGLMLSVSLISGLLAGIYPAWYTTSFAPALVLKGSFGLSPTGRRLRLILISFQYVISLTLIMVAFFIREQNEYIRNFPIGFDQQNVLVTPISHDVYKKGDVFVNELLKNPDIRHVAFSSGAIVSDSKGMWGGFKYKEHEDFTLSMMWVSPDFIETLGLKLSAGRGFLPEDTEKRMTLIPNETARNMYDLELNDEIPVQGLRPQMVGFVEDFHFQPLHYAVQPLALAMRRGDTPLGSWELTAYFRVNTTNIPQTIEYIRNTIAGMGTLSRENIHIDFLDQSIGNLYRQEQDLSVLITLFSLFTIFISLIGVFGLVLFEAQYRRKEIGIRKVHGATIAEILRLLNNGFVKIVLICFVIAVPVSYYAMKKWLEGFAYQSPIHWWIFAVALMMVLAITLLTVTLQSYRAATENPANSIKTE